MIKKKLNQSGFAALELLLIVVLLTALGGGGYYVWHKNQNKPSSNTANSSGLSTVANNTTGQSASPSNTATTCSTTGLNIAAWSVSLPVKPSDLGKTCYTLTSNNTELMFSSELQQSMPSSCNLSQSSGPWGIMRYTDSTVDPSQKNSLTQIGNYYYQFVYPQQGCSQANTLNSDYQKMFQSLEVD